MNNKQKIIMFICAIITTIIVYLSVINDIEKLFCIFLLGFWTYGLTINYDKRNSICKSAFELLTISNNYPFKQAVQKFDFVKEAREIDLQDVTIVAYKKSDNTAILLDCFVAYNDNCLYRFPEGINIIFNKTYWNKIIKIIQKDANYLLQHPANIHGQLFYIPQKNTNKGEFWILDAEFSFK